MTEITRDRIREIRRAARADVATWRARLVRAESTTHELGWFDDESRRLFSSARAYASTCLAEARQWEREVRAPHAGAPSSTPSYEGATEAAPTSPRLVLSID
jgi:hypothetical protein